MKKQKKKTKVSKRNIMPDLPQNIIQVGDRVLDEKNIYIHQKVYAQIHKFAANKTDNEHGGVLVGRVLNEMGKENIIIEGFIEAKYNTATPTTLTFTHETWDYFHSELEKRHKDKKIVGWIHTHPNFGIFLSENDRFIQENFFKDSNQMAYVVDPIQHDEGFFFWVNENLERCPGFYLFDRNGTKIKQKPWKTGDDSSFGYEGDAPKKPYWVGAIVALLLIVNVLLFINQIRISDKYEQRIGELETKVSDMEVIIQYGMIGYGAPEISQIANQYRQQVERQKQLQMEIEKQNKEEQSQENSEEKTDKEKTETNQGNTPEKK